VRAKSTGHQLVCPSPQEWQRQLAETITAAKDDGFGLWESISDYHY